MLSQSEKVKIGKAETMIKQGRPKDEIMRQRILECMNDPRWNGTVSQINKWTGHSRCTIKKVLEENGALR